MTDKKPVLIVVAGPNGSGKTSVTSRILHHEWLENSVYINPDIVAQERFGDWNSEEAVLKSIKYCEGWREKCLLEKKSLIFETVLSADDKIDYIKSDGGRFLCAIVFCLHSIASHQCFAHCKQSDERRTRCAYFKNHFTLPKINFELQPYHS